MTKEKQIEEITKIIFMYDSVNSTDEDVVRCAKYLYNAGYRKQSEWISVEERLPEEDERYLCYGYWTDNNTCGIYIVLYSFGQWMSYSDFAITHWMPLPEAPKMKGGEE